MKPASFTYHAPTSVDEAIALLAKWGPQGGRILAGGQSLVPIMAFRMAQPAHLIDLMEKDGIVGPPDGTRPREVLKGRNWMKEFDDAGQ